MHRILNIHDMKIHRLLCISHHHVLFTTGDVKCIGAIFSKTCPPTTTIVYTLFRREARKKEQLQLKNNRIWVPGSNAKDSEPMEDVLCRLLRFQGVFTNKSSGHGEMQYQCQFYSRWEKVVANAKCDWLGQLSWKMCMWLILFYIIHDRPRVIFHIYLQISISIRFLRFALCPCWFALPYLLTRSLHNTVMWGLVCKAPVPGAQISDYTITKSCDT